MRVLTGAAAAATLLIMLTGCESTADRAAKISAHGLKAFSQHGLSVRRVDPQIHIVGRSLVQDQNGTAAVVELRNVGRRTIANAPIALVVRGSGGRAVFSNNAPGLESDLSHVPLLPPGRVVTWVDDQVQPAGKPTGLTVRVGAGKLLHRLPAQLPLSGLSVIHDPSSGWEITGHVRNPSAASQLHLVLFAVGRRGGRVVAAGRAIITKLGGGRNSVFHAFLIGNPQGAQLSVNAPPSILG